MLPRKLRRKPHIPSGRAVRRTSLGLAVGGLVGWFAGLLKAPKK